MVTVTSSIFDEVVDDGNRAEEVEPEDRDVDEPPFQVYVMVDPAGVTVAANVYELADPPCTVYENWVAENDGEIVPGVTDRALRPVGIRVNRLIVT